MSRSTVPPGNQSLGSQSLGNQRRESFSPEPVGDYRQRACTFLEDMSDEQYKTFHVSIK